MDTENKWTPQQPTTVLVILIGSIFLHQNTYRISYLIYNFCLLIKKYFSKEKVNIPSSNSSNTIVYDPKNKYKDKFDLLDDTYILTDEDKKEFDRRLPIEINSIIKKYIDLIYEMNEDELWYDIRIAEIKDILSLNRNMDSHYAKTISELYTDSYDEEMSCIGSFSVCEYSDLTTVSEKRQFYANIGSSYWADRDKIHEKLKNTRAFLNDDKQIELDATKKIRDEIIKRASKKLKHNYIIENTPHGNILVVYDSDRYAFCYFNDFQIPYDYIIAAIRKYTITFHCEYVFELKPPEMIEEKKKSDSKKTDSEKDVVEEKEKETTEDNNNDDIYVKPKTKSQNDSKNKEIINPEYDIKIIRVGKFSGFNFMQKKQSEKKIVKTSFQEWKNKTCKT
jgi:hypothetical protein